MTPLGEWIAPVNSDNQADASPPNLATRARLPWLEYAILAVGLACNTCAKYIAISRLAKALPRSALLSAVGCDSIFFGGLALILTCFASILPHALARRINLLLAVCACYWSLANAGWLINTGAQLHIGAVTSLFQSPAELGSIAANRLFNMPWFAVPVAIISGAMTLAVLVRFIWPGTGAGAVGSRKAIWIAPAMLILIGLVLSSTFSNPDPRAKALEFSSHWFAVACLTGHDGSARPDETSLDRHVARQNDRAVTLPDDATQRPLVIVVVMESTGLWATSLAGLPRSQTPALAELAEHGVWFQTARAVVTHTTESLFSILTGVFPSLDGGFVEAVPVDTAYESLATLLRRNGYRTRFAQMVRGSFECSPGLVANLGFEEFWAREDADDPAAHVGYFAGDDFKMIGPAMQWLDRQSAPCFMTFLTSVAHHPYETPAWFGVQPADPRRAYLHCVRYTDAFLGELVSQLKQRRRFDDTLLCVVGDHGEGMPDDGIAQHNENPLDSALRVPWIVSCPRKISSARIVRENCSLLDVTPTLLDLIGFDIHSAGFDGATALSLPAERVTFFSGWRRESPAGFIQGKIKNVYWPELSSAYRYDLAKDDCDARPESLDDAARDRLKADIARWRDRNRITFDAKRFRKRLVFDRWHVSSLGDRAWSHCETQERP